MTEVIEPVEAVIISGPRRGEIVRLADEAILELSDEDIEALNQALDEVIAAIDRVRTEVRLTIDTFRIPTETV
jgi:Asp-tRNA(Asn)/Glu-tRNA(Gln) amidotransferase C subunit